MILKALVVADPVGNIAELVTTQCKRLARTRRIATTGEHALALVSEYKPEVVVLALEIAQPPVEKLIPKLIKACPDVFIVASFRELTVPKMEQLNRLGVDDFVAQPINATEIFRAVSRRFHMPFRQHPRFDVALDVIRPDGVMLGRTTNVSEGGLRMEVSHALQPNESVLVDVLLPDQNKLRVRCRVLHVDGAPPVKVMVRAQFENLRGEEQRRLVKFIDNLDQSSESETHA